MTVTTTYDALDIAKKVVSMTNTEQGDSITNLKLQKLLYYLQGFWLAVYDSPLFDEEIEAWMYGPVVPRVYEAYKQYGRNAIPVEECGAVIELNTKQEESLFLDVYNLYNQYSATTLVRMTHHETPWAMSMVGKGEVIPREQMRKYFLTQVEQ